MKKINSNILFVFVLLSLVAVVGSGLASRLDDYDDLDLLYGGSVGCKTCSNQTSNVYECFHTNGTQTCHPQWCIRNLIHFAKCVEQSCGTACPTTYDAALAAADQWKKSGAANLCADYAQAYYTCKAYSTCSPGSFTKRCHAGSCPGNIMDSTHQNGRYKCN